MSTQIELRATVPAELADLLEIFFFETESCLWGIMQRERDDPYELFGFFPDEITAERALSELRQDFPELPEDLTRTRIQDSDWQNAYKKFVKPWSDRNLHWIPLWEKENISIPEDAAVVYLDAGMAFGTGAHETTRLCALRLLDYLEKEGLRLETARIVDAGCGSGILAFSAAGLGFRNVFAFDFDPEAIRVCMENVGYNPQIANPVEFAAADLAAGLTGRQADLLLANIQSDVLIPNSDVIIQAVAPSGALALSGILSKEVHVVRAHYESRFADLTLGAVETDCRTDGEWADLLIRRL